MAKKKTARSTKRQSKARQTALDSPGSDQLAAWKASVTAAENKMSIGKSFQQTGLSILEKIDSGDHLGEPADVAKLLAQATRTIEKGAKMECDAVDQLLELQRNRPRVNSDC